MYTSTAWPFWELITGKCLPTFGSTTRHERLNRQIVRESHVKFCPACARAQFADHFVSWWEICCNLPLVAVCPRHSLALRAVPIGRVWAGTLPHELLNEGVPVGPDADMRSSRIARNVLALHESSCLIDPAIAIELTKDLRERVSNPVKFRRLLGKAANYVLDNSVVPYEPLFRAGDLEFSLNTLLVAECEISGVLAAARRISTIILPDLHQIRQQALNGIRRRATRHGFTDPLTGIGDSCKQRLLDHYSRTPPTIESLANFAPEILFLFETDRIWLDRFIETHQLACDDLFPLTDARRQAGMYLWLAALARRLGDTSARPDVKQLIRRDPIVPEWGDSFVGACARRIDGFVSHISGPRQWPRRVDFNAVIDAVNALLSAPPS